ncbi:MAG: FGGY family carbohydrate kinase [Ilumatobacteraceae bacterium]
MTMHVLAVDLGSTGIKVAVVDAHGVLRSSAGEVLPLLFGANGAVEQDPHGWWDALGRCARRAVADAGVSSDDVRLVAVTSQYMSTTPVRADGVPLGNTIMWMDQRGRRHNRGVRPRVDRQRWVDVHGLAPSGNDDIGHVHLIEDEWPDVHAATAAYVEPMDALAARLTGTVTATQNTMFPMLSVDNRTWGSTEYSDELLEMSGMPRHKLPRLVGLGEPRGTVTADAAEHLGVSAAAVVTGATIDSVTSAIGTGAVAPDTCGLIIGTTAVMATHLPAKCHDIEHGLTTAPSPLPDSYLLVAENGIGGKALDVFVNNMVFADDGLGQAAHAASYDDVLAAAATSPCGSNGVLFLPWLIGSMAPGHERRMRGGFVNVGLATTRADMARAVIEGVAMNAAWLLPYFSALAGRTYDTIGFGGGGAASPLWGQTLADAFGVAVRRLAHPSCTNAHGAALLALAETGHCSVADLPGFLVTAQVHEPDPAHHALLATRIASLIDFHTRNAAFYDAFDRKDPPS